MVQTVSARKSNARLKLARSRAAIEPIDGRGDIAGVDATYGDTLRHLMPRRLSALSRPRPRV
jgi:hypothetical protein